MVSDMRQMQVESKLLSRPACSSLRCAVRSTAARSDMPCAGLLFLALPWKEQEGPISSVGQVSLSPPPPSLSLSPSLPDCACMQRDGQYLDPRHSILDSVDAIERMDFDTQLRGESIGATA